jgi:hypothetical protein
MLARLFRLSGTGEFADAKPTATSYVDSMLPQLDAVTEAR